MVTLYQWGEDGLLLGSVALEETDRLPERTTPTPPPPELTGAEVARWAGGGWEKLSEAPTPEVSEEVIQAVIARYEYSVQTAMDSAAKQRGYDSLFTAISYAEEPAVPRFQADGQAFRRWRSLVWDYAHTELNAVMAGQKPQPDLDSFLADLPVLELPT